MDSAGSVRTYLYMCIYTCAYAYMCNKYQARKRGYEFECGRHGRVSRMGNWELLEEGQRGERDVILLQLKALFKKK